MLTCTPSKPIFFASATESILRGLPQVPIGHADLELHACFRGLGGVCDEFRCESAATVAAAPDCKKRRLEIVHRVDSLS